MRRLLPLVLAACGHSHPATVDAMPASTDAPSALLDAAADASPDASTDFVIPPMDVGMISVSGSCTDVYHGWGFNDATGCSPVNRTYTNGDTRQITIAADGQGGYQLTTMLLYDALENLWYDPYTVTVSQAQPTARKVNSPNCNPIYGTCVEHDWTLAPHSLALATHSLHDNSSSTPLPQCWEYYYEKIDCTFELDW
jgi:hypothetical protein